MKKKLVIDYLGSVALVAKKLNITGGAVSQWGEIIPERSALKLERITNGALKYDPTLYSKSHTPNTQHEVE